MNILYPAGVKREWFDRNAVIGNQQYSQVLAPHAATQRLIYTVPVGSKAFLQGASFYIVRVTAATTADKVSVYFTHSDGSNVITLYQLTMNDNTLNKPYFGSFFFNLYAMQNQYFRVSTEDLSTGGTNIIIASFSVVTFDS